MDTDFCCKRGVELIQSGPSGGVTAAVAVGEWSGYKDLIAVDMGGTSYDVCLIKDGRPDIGVDSWVSRYRVATPMIDIHSIGTGGGSIAWIDEGGRTQGKDPGARGPTRDRPATVAGGVNPQSPMPTWYWAT